MKEGEGVWEKAAPFLTVFSGIREESIADGFVPLFIVTACLSVCLSEWVCEEQRRADGQETLSVHVYYVENIKWSLSSLNTRENQRTG